MLRLRRTVGWMLATVMALGLGSSVARADTEAEVRREIEQVAREMQEALRQRDVARLVDFYTADAEVFGTFQAVIRGRNQLESHMEYVIGLGLGSFRADVHEAELLPDQWLIGESIPPLFHEAERLASSPAADENLRKLDQRFVPVIPELYRFLKSTFGV